MEKFFDRVNHSKLIEVTSRTVKDGRVVSLVHRYLNAGVVVSHKYEETNEGVPQGGPLSLILSNILLNELDKELDRKRSSVCPLCGRLSDPCEEPACHGTCTGQYLRVHRKDTVPESEQGEDRNRANSRQEILGYTFY